MSDKKKGYFRFAIGAVLLLSSFWLISESGILNEFGQNKNSPQNNIAKMNSDNILTANEPYDIYDNGYFRFGYDENHEQARWLAYSLTVENLNKKRLPRLKDFVEDKKIKTRSARTHDYRGSGLSRGHLAPSADFSYSLESMQETYKMSNISPQKIKFNGGIWRELEEQTRDWARSNRAIHVTTGPILDHVNTTIGKNQVSVPESFYKVLLVKDGRKSKAIGFIIPNEVSFKHLNKYVTSVDEVEEKTGIDFFKSLQLPNEEQIEKSVHLDQWTFDNRRFDLRVKKWNKQ